MFEYFPASVFRTGPAHPKTRLYDMSAAQLDNADHLLNNQQPRNMPTTRWINGQIKSEGFVGDQSSEARLASQVLVRSEHYICTKDRLLKVNVQLDGDTRQGERICPYPVTNDLALQTVGMKAPSEPGLVRAMLPLLRPKIVYNKYTCPEQCRSRGICVHFSYVMGGRHAPDGLICSSCHAFRKEQAVSANRKCAMHNKSGVSCYTQNLAEDYLATSVQAAAASERLRRSLEGDWTLEE